jgi:hypothetical protein
VYRAVRLAALLALLASCRAKPAPRLDRAAIRTRTAHQVAHAKQLVAAHPTDNDRAMLTPDGRFLSLTHDLTGTTCWLGARAVCDALTPLVESCDAGSAADCNVVAQYIADEPPRMLIGISFIARACALGDQAACARRDAARTATTPCESDPWACSFRASLTQDAALHEQACALGAAESCQILAATADPATARALVETGCQLGNPISCMALAHQLAPSCQPQPHEPCFPPDASEAAEARAIACEAGWLTGSDCN